MNQNITYPGPESGLGPFQWYQRTISTLQQKNAILENQITLLQRPINPDNNTSPLAHTAANPNLQQTTNRSLTSRIIQTLIKVSRNTINLYACFTLDTISTKYLPLKTAHSIIPFYYTLIDYIMNYGIIKENTHESIISKIISFFKNYIINLITISIAFILLAFQITLIRITNHYYYYINFENYSDGLICLAIALNISNYIVDKIMHRYVN